MNYKRLILSVLVAVLVGGCYPGGVETYNETDLVLTTHDKDYPFGGSKTYAMPDKIPKISTTPPSNGQLPQYLDAATANIIFNQIRTNMTKRGYTQTVGNAKADMTITPAVLSVTTLVTYCADWWGYWSWWGYYPGYPGYGGCYYPVGYTYTNNSLLISMLEDKTEDGNATTPVLGVWAAAINGLLSGSTSTDSQRIQATIDQAFVQSPYIQSAK